MPFDPLGVARLSTTGAVLATRIDVATSDRIALASGPGHTLLTYSDQNLDVVATRVSRTADVVNALDAPPILLSRAATSQVHPSAAFNGTNYLVAWEDVGLSAGAATRDIFAVRMTQAGSVLDSAGLLLSGAAGDQTFPVSASNGQGYLAAWGDASRILASAVAAAGAVTNPGGVLISGASAGTNAAIASDGSSYLVVWQAPTGIAAARPSGAGALVDATPHVLSATAGDADPALAFNGTNYLVVWHRAGSVFGKRVAPDGTVLDASEIRVVQPMIGRNRPLLRAAVASDGQDWLVTFDDRPATPTNAQGNIYGRWVAANGTLPDASAIAYGPFTGTYAFQSGTAWSGRAYWILWEEDQGTGSLYNDVLARRVSRSGVQISSCVISSTKWYTAIS